MKKNIEEVIDMFSITASLSKSSDNLYTVPTATTGSDYYLLNKVLIFSEVTSSGTTTGTSGNNTLIDSTATFQTNGVAPEDRVSVVISNGVVTNLSSHGYK